MDESPHHPNAGSRDDRSEREHPRLESGADHGPVQSFEFEPGDLHMVRVIWKDAESQGGPTWEDTDDMLEFARRPLTLVTTVGVLLHLDHEQIAITDTVAHDQMGGVTKIPRAWVERFEHLAPTGTDHGFEDLPEEDRPRRVG